MPTFDTLSFVGLERSHLRSAVYRRVFGDDTGPVRIGRYSILERIGSGARGVVFKAFDNQLDRLVALKVLSIRAGHQAELLREAKALARLSHPNVLPVYEVGETDEGQVFLATEYVKGWTLRGWYDEEHRSEAAIVDVMRQVALGVQAAHDEGLVHRDLKPANILLGGDGRVRVADFGLARFDPTAVEPNAELPADGLATTTAGTPGYMAPELFDGRPASAASDQYALAVTLHELLAGEIPTSAESVSVRRTRSSSVIRRGLSLAPEDRYPSVRKFADALAPRASRGKLGTAALVGAGMLFLGGIGAGALVRSATGDENSSSEVALLKAKAELPDDPAAALDALRQAPNLDAKMLLPVAEQALSAGPETTRFQLPAEAEHPRLLGDLLLYRLGDELLGARLSKDGAQPVDTATLGVKEKSPSFMGSPVRLEADEGLTLRTIDPWAFESLDRDDSRAVASADGRFAARVDTTDGGVLRVVDLQTGATVWSFDAPLDAYFGGIDIDDDGTRVTWTYNDGRAFMHDLTSDVTYSLPVESSGVSFDKDEDFLIVRGRNRSLYHLRISDNRRLHIFPEEKLYFSAIQSPDRRWLAASAEGGSVIVAELGGLMPIEIEGEQFSFSPDNEFLAVNDESRINLLHLPSGDMRTIPSGGKITHLGFAADGSLWTIGGDGYVRRHAIMSPKVLTAGKDGINHVGLSRDGSIAVAASRDFKIWIWDVESERGRVLTDVDWSVRGVFADSAARRVVVAQSPGDTHFFDLDSGEETGTAPPCVGPPSIGPGGAVVCGSKAGVWSNKDGATTVLGESLGCGPSTADDSLIAALCRDGEQRAVHVWVNGEHHQAPTDGSAFMDSVHVWPDSRHLLHVSQTKKRLFAMGENGALTDMGVVDALPSGDRFMTPTVSSRYGDLLYAPVSGIYAAWNTTDEPVRINSATESFTLALSGDGSSYAYPVGNSIVVRRRPISALRPNLAEVLAAHEVVEGEL